MKESGARVNDESNAPYVGLSRLKNRTGIFGTFHGNGLRVIATKSFVQKP